MSLRPLVPFPPPGDRGASSHLVSLRHPTLPAADVQRELAHAGIVVSPRGGRLRVSLHLYNDSADIAALVRALEVLETQSGPATTG